MIITTTPSIEGKKIVDYKGIVFGEVISGVDFIKDFAAGLTNFFNKIQLPIVVYLGSFYIICDH